MVLSSDPIPGPGQALPPDWLIVVATSSTAPSSFLARSNCWVFSNVSSLPSTPDWRRMWVHLSVLNQADRLVVASFLPKSPPFCVFTWLKGVTFTNITTASYPPLNLNFGLNMQSQDLLKRRQFGNGHILDRLTNWCRHVQCCLHFLLFLLFLPLFPGQPNPPFSYLFAAALPAALSQRQIKQSLSRQEKVRERGRGGCC